MDGCFIATEIAIGAVGFTLLRRMLFWAPILALVREKIPDRESFEEFADRTRTVGAAEMAETSTFLTERIVKLYDESNEATKGQEAKATTILGFVGGGAGIYALAVESKVTAHPSVGCLLALAIVFLMLSLICCLLCLAGRTRPGLGILREEFADAQTLVLNDAIATKARVIAYVYMELCDRYAKFRQVNVIKSYYMEAAQQFFAFGAITLVANYGVTALESRGTVAPGTKVHCTAAAPLQSATGLDCTITGG